MLKKIFIAVLLVGFIGVLIWGGVNRTLAKSGESTSDAQSNGNGHGHNGEALDLEGHEHDHSDANLGQGGRRAGAGAVECDESHDHENDDIVAGTQGRQNGNGRRGQGNGGGRGRSGEPLDENEIQALEMALDDEYHALAVYNSVMDDFGPVEPFVEIAKAEQRHIDALLNQFDKHGLPVPENTWIGNVPSFESVQAACTAGVEAEIANADLYDQLFSVTDDPALIQVFTNLQRASQESHLPEFENCQ